MEENKEMMNEEMNAEAVEKEETIEKKLQLMMNLIKKKMLKLLKEVKTQKRMSLI